MNDGLTVTFQTTPAFDKGLAALIHRVGLNAKTVLKKETAELVKTLVKTSPPANLSKAKTKAAQDIRGVFRPMPRKVFTGEQAGGAKGIRWLYSTNDALTGVSETDFKPNMDVVQAAQKLGRDRRTRGNAYSSLGRRGNQKVTQLNRTVIARRTYNQLVTEIKSRFGRLKASWLVSATRGPIQLTGSNMPPAWVRKHAPGAKGTYINGLEKPGNPTFTIISTARGIGQPVIERIIKSAMSIRGRAMQANALLFMKGKKKISDYA